MAAAQLLSFPHLVTSLVNENDLFGIFLKCTGDFFKQHSIWTEDTAAMSSREIMELEQLASSSATGTSQLPAVESGRRRRRLINLYDPAIQAERSPWERIVSDLDLALDHVGTSALFLFETPPEVFSHWQGILDLLQGATLPNRLEQFSHENSFRNGHQ